MLTVVESVDVQQEDCRNTNTGKIFPSGDAIHP